MRRSKQMTALAVALCLSVPVQAAENSFPDVPADSWYAGAVGYCLDQGLMAGGDGLFRPEDTMTRAMAAQVLYNAAGAPAPEGAGGFPDVSGDSWYADAAQWALETGVIQGNEHGHFLGEDPVTREQFAAILWRQAGRAPASKTGDFTDREQISPFAREAVDWAADRAVVTGLPDGRFAPGEKVTRAQAAMMLMNTQEGPGTSSDVSLLALGEGTVGPSGMALGEDGLVLTDLYNRKVWKLRDGKREPLAGGDTAQDVNGQPVGGYHDGPADWCSFKTPWAVAPFLDGWAVSDPENNAIRLISGGNVRTLNCSTKEAGLPTSGGRVTFAYPTGLAADGDGNLYVSDTHRGAIRKITPDGGITTFADGLSDPMGLCWSGDTLYVAETGANRIVKIEKGRLSTVAGSGEEGSGDGGASQASFAFPQGVAADRDGTVYVADTGNGAVRRVREGEVTTLLSREEHWEQEEDMLPPASPTGLLLVGETLYVCDSFNWAVYGIGL